MPLLEVSTVNEVVKMCSYFNIPSLNTLVGAGKKDLPTHPTLTRTHTEERERERSRGGERCSDFFENL